MTLRAQASKIYYSFKKEAAKISYSKIQQGPDYLAASLLPKLDADYKYDNTVFYDFDSNMKRAKERYTFLNDKLNEYNKTLKNSDVLELGCGDGLICALVKEQGARSVAIDIDNSLFDKYASDRGVVYKTMDASNLEFKDATFDVIFSHNGFEHFSDPAAVYRECRRVLRPGGMMYFQFNPLYYSPFGFHAYKSIPVPYLHILFSENDILNFALKNNRPEVNVNPLFLNRKPADYFRKLFSGEISGFENLHYAEEKNNYFVDFIRNYPSCFRKENVSFDDFVTSGIRIWTRRNPS